MASKTIDFLINVKGNADQALSKMGDAAGRAYASVGPLNAGMGTLGVAALGAATAFRSLADEITGNVDKMNTLSKASGLSIQTIKGMEQAARASGKSLDSIIPKKLAKNMLDASRGSKEAAENFAALGVDVVDASGNMRSADAVFRDLIDSLGKMENGAEAAALAGKIMGAEGRELLSAFSDSSALDGFVNLTEKYGIKVGPEAVAATGRWQTANANLSLAFDDLKQSIFDALGGTDGAAKIIQNFANSIIFLSTLTEGILSDMAGRWSTFFKGIKTGDMGDIAQLFTPDPAKLGQVVSEAWKRAGEFAKDSTSGGADPLVGPLLDTGGGGGGGGGVSSKPVPVKVDQQMIEMLDYLAQTSQAEGERLAALAQEQLDAQNGALVFARSSSELLASIDALQRQAPSAMLDGIAGIMATDPGQMMADAIRGLPGGGLVVSIANIAGNMAGFVNGVRKNLEEGPLKIGRSFSRAMQTAIPKLIEALPTIVENLLFKLPTALARGIVLGVPKIFAAFFRMLGEQLSKLFNFLKGGEDKNILTGKRGKWLGTSFEKGNFSIFGIGNRKKDSLKGEFATGGFVPQTGAYLLHAGERVMPTSGTSTGSASRAARGFSDGASMMVGTMNVTVHTNDARDLIRQIRRELGGLGTGASLEARS